ncbi:MAG: L-threonylcarbamoyladenylate synthase [Pseudomonadota bacterium]
MSVVRHAPVLPADAAALEDGARLLTAGRLVAFPTETVYGLGALASCDQAVAGIFEAKRRPRFNPLILHLAEADQAKALVHFDSRAARLAARFWPGPLSLVLPRRTDCSASLLCSAGLDCLAVRVPAHPVARGLLERLGAAVAAPSANASGEVSPTTAAHVSASLGDRIALILDGGPCRVGLESTVIDLTEPIPRLLRPGAVTAEQAAEEIGPLAGADETQPLRAPGQLTSHYAPNLPLRLNATDVGADEALLAFGPAPLSGAAETINLSSRNDLVEAAAKLFAALRALDKPHYRAIAVMAVPDGGLGAAINDRLRRAAAPKS